MHADKLVEGKQPNNMCWYSLTLSSTSQYEPDREETETNLALSGCTLVDRVVFLAWFLWKKLS